MPGLLPPAASTVSTTGSAPQTGWTSRPVSWRPASGRSVSTGATDAATPPRPDPDSEPE